MKPTDTVEFIGELNAGVFANQIGHALSEVAAGVVDNKKVGTVTLTFSLKQIADSHRSPSTTNWPTKCQPSAAAAPRTPPSIRRCTLAKVVG